MNRIAAWTIIGITLTFLIGPFFIIIGAALSAGSVMSFPPEGLSTQWFAKVFAIDSFRNSFYISIALGLGSPFFALILGVPASYAMARYDVRGAGVVRLLVSAPIIVPGIIVGLALLRYIVLPTGIGLLTALFLAHTALVLPYAVRVVSASMDNLRVDIEEAATLLGCSRFGAFTRVVLPNIRGGILAAFILGFVTSFNEVPVALFLSGPGVTTLPIDMIGYMEINYDPSVAALAALLALLSITIVFAAEKFLGLSRYV